MTLAVYFTINWEVIVVYIHGVLSNVKIYEYNMEKLNEAKETSTTSKTDHFGGLKIWNLFSAILRYTIFCPYLDTLHLSDLCFSNTFFQSGFLFSF